MKNERIFIKEAKSLLDSGDYRKLSGDILIHEFKSSDLYRNYDMLKYRLDDPDKSPSLIWDSGEVFEKDYHGRIEATDYLEGCWKQYCEMMLTHTKGILNALETELEHMKDYE